MRLAFGAVLALSMLAGAVSAAPEKAITVMASSISEPAMAEAADLADALADGGLRILPVAGEGPVQTLTDLVQLDGINAAILPADVTAFARRNLILPGIGQRVAFIAKTGSADIHVLARGSITSLQDLQGKRVNLGNARDHRFVSGSVIFATLGIAIVPVPGNPGDAIDLLRNGAIDAVVITAQKPSALLAPLKAKDGFLLLAIPASAELAGIYAPQILSAADYPLLIGTAETISTLTVSNVLAVVNAKPGTPAHHLAAKLSAAVFSDSALLQDVNRRTNWKDINLAAAIPGWTRHAAAASSMAASPDNGARFAAEFRTFLADNPQSLGDTDDEAALLERFEDWKKTKGKEPQ